MMNASGLDPGSSSFADFIVTQGAALRAEDRPAASRKEWDERRVKLRLAMFTAMGSFPERVCPLEPRVVSVLKRSGYRIENLIFQSKPDVWVTASAYVPEGISGRVPAVLAVHGHWPWARRDPVVQARCVGLVKLGFLVLAVDAFGAGERYPTPARGTYHGALFGSTLWPVGQTLLGMQVYDNRRAVDYLRERPEVDGARLGITGASGGGNQSMYAGALDERFRAVVPVCSVGTYQAYLRAACCVCEVLPSALRFMEEGEALALVAPRALMVISAAKDGYQFSVGEATKSLARARTVFRLYEAEAKLRHAIFDSGHDYNQQMREAMYGWMTKWLKHEGDGKPIPEPEHAIESPDDLRCFPTDSRPKGFHFPPTFAAQTAATLLLKYSERQPDHSQDWESTAIYIRDQLRKEVFGDFPRLNTAAAQIDKSQTADRITTILVSLRPEPGLILRLTAQHQSNLRGRRPACVLLHMDGKDEAVKHPLWVALLSKGWIVLSADLRATGASRPAGDAIAGALDHNSAEHSVWIGRPLLGQWVFDVLSILDWMGTQPEMDSRRFAVVGLGQAGVVAICAAGIFDDRVASAAALQTPATYVTRQAYHAGTHMGLLAPRIVQIADIPQLAALIAPRRLTLAEAISFQGEKLSLKQLQGAYSFTHSIYKLYKAEDQFTIAAELSMEELAGKL
ncbi:MAG TPA: alpha/beta hydrolase family protein [Gemmataceae bacterium]|nr:alpha/beta hydrolase family protein [Gemmataceae bacterium]